MSRFPRAFISVGAVFSIAFTPLALAQVTDPLINEFVNNHTGSDTYAFVEIFGDASTDYSAFTLLEIEGDSGPNGIIDEVNSAGTTNAGGYSLIDTDAENGRRDLYGH